MLRALKFPMCLVVAIAIAGSGAFRVHAQQPASGQTAINGWIPLFNGSSLDGWDGRSDVWKVEDGTITGEEPAGGMTVIDTTYISWKGGELSDFDLKVDIKAEGPWVNSGIVYRGFVSTAAEWPAPKEVRYKLGGPQLDFDGSNRYSGQYFEIATDRGLLARRGQIVEKSENPHPKVIGILGDDSTMGGYVKVGDWNHLRIIAHGRTLTHLINGHVVAELIDTDPVNFRPKGLLAFQLEGAGEVRFRNIWLKIN